MEYVELLETVGVPGAALILMALAGRVLWGFFTQTIYPNMREDRQEAAALRRDELQNEREQQIWMVEQFQHVTANMQRLLDRMRTLEDACWRRTFAEMQEKGLSNPYETQPIPPEVQEEIRKQAEERNQQQL